MEWRPIETAPRDGTCILVYEPGERPGEANLNISLVHFSEYGYGSPDGGWRLCETGGWAEDSDPMNDTPTHWMTLPPPPSSEPAA